MLHVEFLPLLIIALAMFEWLRITGFTLQLGSILLSWNIQGNTIYSEQFN